ncbi:MAG: YaeQ family protein [Candidatus Binatia bacterium]
MALKATIFKVNLQIADMDRGYYESHALTIARHPSETSERMMIRVLAFALSAHERLQFGGGVSTADEPDLWRRSLSGEIEQWIELGQPDPRRIHRACGRADEVRVYLYGGMKSATWWEQERAGLERHANLRVAQLPADQTAHLGELADRGISLQCNIQDGEVWMILGETSVHVTPVVLFGA